MTDERYRRYSGLISPEDLKTTRVSIVGVGAIGRQLALQLAAMGQTHITLFDFDVVEEVNLGPQGYFVDDIGSPKVEATAEVMRKQNPGIDLVLNNRRLGAAEDVGSVMFCCVDSIDTRSTIWERYSHRVDLLIDARMSAETLRVLTASTPDSREYYPSTLFRAEEATGGSCTERSTIYTANIAAGMMVQQYTKYLRGMPLDKDLLFNLLASDIVLDAETCLS